MVGKLDSSTLKKIDEMSVKEDNLLETLSRNKKDRLGGIAFNDLMVGTQYRTSQNQSRHTIIDGRSIDYFTVGFNRDFSVCYLGISEFYLRLMGFESMGLAWVNKETASGVTYINLTFKRQSDGFINFANQKLAVPVFELSLREKISKATTLCVVATSQDDDKKRITSYFAPMKFDYVRQRDGSESAKSSSPSPFKRTNF